MMDRVQDFNDAECHITASQPTNGIVSLMVIHDPDFSVG